MATYIHQNVSSFRIGDQFLDILTTSNVVVNYTRMSYSPRKADNITDLLKLATCIGRMYTFFIMFLFG